MEEQEKNVVLPERPEYEIVTVELDGEKEDYAVLETFAFEEREYAVLVEPDRVEDLKFGVIILRKEADSFVGIDDEELDRVAAFLNERTGLTDEEIDELMESVECPNKPKE